MSYPTGVFAGTTLIQQKGEFGGARSVFVKIQGNNKNDMVFPTFGAQLKNPFKGAAKIYAADLFEIRYDSCGENPELYLLKTYEVESVSGNTVNIVRNGYRHIPFVGDKIGVAPEELGGKVTAATVTAVKEAKVGNVDVWAVTVDSALTAKKGDVLVEADENGEMYVKMINGVAICDYDCFYANATGATNRFDAARYFLAPAMHATAYICKMSPMPACVLKLNKSRMNGWYEL